MKYYYCYMWVWWPLTFAETIYPFLLGTYVINYYITKGGQLLYGQVRMLSFYLQLHVIMPIYSHDYQVC